MRWASLCLAAALLSTCCDALRPELLQRILYDEPNEQLRELGQVSDKAGSLERTFLSPAHKQAAVKIQQIMEEAGMDAYIDKVANVRGRVRGRDGDAPVLLAGSHYDTVKDAGRFDGMLGILVPIAAVKALLIQAAVEAGRLDEEALLAEPHISLEDHLKHSEVTKLIQFPIEVIAFSEEEGVRFQTTFLGSRAIVGDLIGSGVLESEDGAGVSVRESLGLTKSAKADRFLSNLAYQPDEVRGYVEVHMEQGPILEAKGLPLGLVTGIAGQTRQLVVIKGTQGHAGTIPMPMRKDPMAAAAEAIAWMERRCGGGSYPGERPAAAGADAEGLMCTTGSVNLWPNAFNVVPGQANFTLDVRSRSDAAWQAAVRDTRAKIEEICRRRGLACEVQHKNSVSAVRSDEGLLAQLRAAVVGSQETLAGLLPGRGGCTHANGILGLGHFEPAPTCDSRHAISKAQDTPQPGAYTPPELLSGAGHDALKLAELTKMAMMFVRCRGGHSHSPLEHVAEADVAAAASAMYKFFQAQLLPGASPDAAPAPASV